MSNPYLKFVLDYAKSLEQGAEFPLGGFAPPPRPARSSKAPKALIFSPHPDDECIMGGLPLRLLRELKWSITNVAVTLGSRQDRQLARLEELRQACGYLGFGLVQTSPRGLEQVNRKGREADPARWKASVAILADILQAQKPQVLFMPHEGDWNSTHIGTHLLVREAMESLGTGFRCRVVLTEYWAAMPQPNVMIESSVADVADLVTALSFHAGEVRRNPYHLRLPAWLMDNVRRGGELVGGQGGQPPTFPFATLYQVLNWSHGAFEPILSKGALISANDSLENLFG